MTDRLTPQQRHICMSHIRGKNTQPELIVRRYLHANGYRFRIHVKRLPGTPDIVLRKYKTAIFVNGCFWHGHEDCKLYVIPKTNTTFWQDKIERNKKRDEEAYYQLKKMGWHVVRLWECQLSTKNRAKYLCSLLFTLNHLMLVNLGAKPIKSYPADDDQLKYAAEE